MPSRVLQGSEESGAGKEAEAHRPREALRLFVRKQGF